MGVSTIPITIPIIQITRPIEVDIWFRKKATIVEHPVIMMIITTVMITIEGEGILHIIMEEDMTGTMTEVAILLNIELGITS
ncbi:MAG: hypothetical protein ACXWTS_10090 [Methylococcaceae bacterium]